MKLETIPISQVDPDPSQPRTHFDPKALASLSRSVREVGLLQPILVRQQGDRYRLVAGERRWRAMKQAGRPTIQALVLNGELGGGKDDRILHLVENLQRQDLDPLERALGIQLLMEAENLNQKQAAERLGVPRTTLVDWLDILRVAPRFQRAVVAHAQGLDSSLTSSHLSEALALAARRDEPELADQVLDLAVTHSLSKVQMRRFCALLRDHPELAPEAALRRVLGPRPSDPPDEDDGQPEAQLQHLLQSLERSASYVERLAHVSSRFVAPELRDQLVGEFERLRNLSARALQRLTAEPEEVAAELREERRRRHKLEKRRRKAQRRNPA